MRIDDLMKMVCATNRGVDGTETFLMKMPEGVDRSCLKPREIVCASDGFAIAEMADEKIGVFWPGHCEFWDSLDELVIQGTPKHKDEDGNRIDSHAVLNNLELTLLRYGVNDEPEETSRRRGDQGS